ncbi:MAG: thermonuclease family protein [Comamonadaceae bacterium]
MVIFARLLLLLTLCLATSADARETFVGQVTYVTDGDTLWVLPDRGGPARKLRIEGIDAPEICQAGGKASRDVLAQRALHQRVTVVVAHYDRYGRGLARIWLSGNDLGAQMVRSGQAWSYSRRRKSDSYAGEQSMAQQSRLGLFAFGAAETPWDFRKRHGSCHVTKR